MVWLCPHGCPDPLRLPKSTPHLQHLAWTLSRASLKGLAPPGRGAPSGHQLQVALASLTRHGDPCHCITPVMATQPLLPEQLCPSWHR